MIQRTYIFDTNIVSGLLHVERRFVLERIRQDQTNVLVLCDPVIYEIERGLKHRQANRQLERLRRNVFPLFTITPVQPADWSVASTLWALARRDGK